MKAFQRIVVWLFVMIATVGCNDSPMAPAEQPEISVNLHPAQQCVSRLALQNGNDTYNLGLMMFENTSNTTIVVQDVTLSIVKMPGNNWAQYKAHDFRLTLRKRLQEGGVIRTSKAADWDAFFQMNTVLPAGETVVLQISATIPQDMPAGNLVLGLVSEKTPPVQATTTVGGSVSVSFENAVGGGATIGSSCPKG